MSSAEPDNREATDIAAEAIARRFGQSAIDGEIQAHIVTIDL